MWRRADSTADPHTVEHPELDDRASVADPAGSVGLGLTLVPALTVDHPTVTITPPSHLKDGQTVEVSVTGFGVGGKVWLSGCASASAVTDLGCGAQLAAQSFLVTDDTRAGSASLVVRAEAAGEPLSATAQGNRVNKDPVAGRGRPLARLASAGSPR